jgi:hypothetical protein
VASIPATNWVVVTGDGIAYKGPCVVKTIVLHPDAAGDYADIYDGRDATSGTKFCRIENAADTTLPIDLGEGVVFGKGIFVDGYDSAVETTVAFVPL